MGIPLRALIVEDSEDDVLLIVRELEHSGYEPVYRRVQTAEEMRSALEERAWDVIVADYAMPHFSGMAALELLRRRGLDTPFIVVSGTIGEDVAVAAMKAGAHDYVLKGNLARLGPAVRRELQEARERRARRQAERSLMESEARFRRMADSIQDGLTIIERGQVVYVNDRACEIVGYPREEYKTMSFLQFAAPEERERLRRLVAETQKAGRVPLKTEFWITRKDGSRRYIQAHCSWSRHDGEIIGHYVVTTDITKRKRAEQLLHALNEAALAMEQALTPQEVFAAVGTEFAKLGWSYAILLLNEDRRTLTPHHLSYDPRGIKAVKRLLGGDLSLAEIPLEAVEPFQQAIREGKSIFVADSEALRPALPTRARPLSVRIARLLRITKSVVAPLIVGDDTLGLLTVQADDLTEGDVPAITAFAHQISAAWRKARLVHELETSLMELKRTQAQLLQAQKMEAVGRLAGGVAHDFNNTLTIIQLSTQLLKKKLRPEDPLWEYVHQIEDASQRAANLTKQLLSFSRQEPIEPKVVNLNRLVGDMGRMLQRIIGEDIELMTMLEEDLWPVYVDPSQIDQAIINLVVNARDAMPQGGRLTIGTANVVLDRAEAERIGAQPGEYVRLTVRDTGIGMDADVLEHIFEPFFTTKEREQGTGLGLSTVFGIVKKHGGHISVTSAPGEGATFDIYLPRTYRSEPSAEEGEAFSLSLRGEETILVVEDDAVVRDLAAQILRSHGYRVLVAKDGEAALSRSREYDGPIHLLLTDIVMPGIQGWELAETLLAQRPQMRVLFTSGYGDRVLAHQEGERQSIAFLPKPFTVESLTQKVRSVLDAAHG